MSKIHLTSSMRSNLLSLQNTSKLQGITQERLATGLKVNSAIDNPSAYYTAQSLSNRASDLSALLDSMGQAIQCVKAATEGAETATSFISQMQAVTEQALTDVELLTAADAGAAFGLRTRAITDYSDYTKIDSSMDAATIQGMITEGAKLVLSEDITLDAGLDINAANVIIDGNGHKITYNSTTAKDNAINISSTGAKITNIEINYTNSSGGAAILIDGNGNDADISAIKINTSGDKTYGIQVTNGASLTLDNTYGITVSGIGSHNLVNGNAEIFDGEANTKAIVGQIGNEGLAAYGATLFVPEGVAANDENFGTGTWYLPSIGELMEVYGFDAANITSGTGTSGVIPASGKTIINATLGSMGDKATTLTDGYYWSSSESSSDISWRLPLDIGARDDNYKDSHTCVRYFQLLENCFNPLSLSGAAGDGQNGAESAPKVGDIMYSDMSYSSTYDSSKTAVGVITSISEDGRSAKIMSLKDITYSNTSSVGNFEPSNPFGNTSKTTQHTTSSKYSTDITGITNYDINALKTALKSGGTVNVTNTITDTGDEGAGGGDGGTGGESGGAEGGNGGSGGVSKVGNNWANQFNSILNQYDMVIKDTSYKGVNLLKGDEANVRFSETGGSFLTVKGQDLSSSALGINKADWKTINDVAASVAELANAVSSLRNFVSELGSNYSILTTREDFTDNLINVLEEGADKLTLADMSEESANMLSLQTRQQLATNALSLSSQASQSILKLF